MAFLAGIAENAPLSVMRLISSLMEGAHLAVGKVGTVGVGTVGSSLIVGSEVPCVLPEAVGTIFTEGTSVTPVSASVTLALFTGAEVGPLTRSFRLLTVDSTARDVMPRQFPPGVPLIREQSWRDGVGHSSRPHSLGVDLGTRFWFLPPMLL